LADSCLLLYYFWFLFCYYQRTLVDVHTRSLYSYCFHSTLFFFYRYPPHRDLHSFPARRSSDLQILKQNAKREMRLRLGKVTVADVLAAQPVTTNLLKFMRASIKMIGVSNLQSFIASMTQKLTLSDISDESKNYLDK